MALRFATVLSESGTDGSGGGFDDAVAVVVVLLLDPVRPARLLGITGADIQSCENLPTEALVAPPLVSQGFGGDGEDIFPRVRLTARKCGC